jgi:hypothetical protein
MKMSFTVTSVSQAREAVEQALEKAERMKENMAKLREKAEGAIGLGIQIAEVSTASMGFGYLNGRFGENGELAWGGVPVDLGAAVLLHGTAFFGAWGKYAEHGHNLGLGALGACAYRTGTQIGANAKAKSKQNFPQAATQPQQPNALPPWMLPPWAGPPAAAAPQAPAVPAPNGVAVPGFPIPGSQGR